jgi:hypothetical protein
MEAGDLQQKRNAGTLDDGGERSMGNGHRRGGEMLMADPFDDLEVPEALQASMKRHRENLAQLVRNLHSAGVGEEQIETSVSVLVDSYRQELLRAIRLMVREG